MSNAVKVIEALRFNRRNCFRDEPIHVDPPSNDVGHVFITDGLEPHRISNYSCQPWGSGHASNDATRAAQHPSEAREVEDRIAHRLDSPSCLL